MAASRELALQWKLAPCAIDAATPMPAPLPLSTTFESLSDDAFDAERAANAFGRSAWPLDELRPPSRRGRALPRATECDSDMCRRSSSDDDEE